MHRLGREDQSPAEREGSRAGAASPAALRVAHADPRHTRPMPRSQSTRAPCELGPQPSREMIADPARQMRRIAAHPNFAVTDRHRRRGRVGLAADAMRDPEHRHDRAFGERHSVRQRLETARDPGSLARQKAQPLACRHARGQHQFDPALGRIDAQPDPPRPRTDSDRQRAAEFESRDLLSDLFESTTPHPRRRATLSLAVRPDLDKTTRKPGQTLGGERELGIGACQQPQSICDAVIPHQRDRSDG